MRYQVLACDYDGTLARDGIIGDETIQSLDRLRSSGRRIILLTGRDLDDLQRVCRCPELFDRIVAENGAVLHDPATHTTRALADPPPPAFIAALEHAQVRPLTVGRVIVATWEPHGAVVLRTIQEVGLELQVIFNKGAVMVLPSGVNKATGLEHALLELKLSRHNTIGVGDAENDHAFLMACECRVAVANALASLKDRVDLVTTADHGEGVSELVARLLRDELADMPLRSNRGQVVLGRAENGDPLTYALYRGSLMIAGPSGGGKTTVTTALLEQLCDQGYQCCVIDPEGDYHELTGAIALRGQDTRALLEETLRVLDRPDEDAVVSLFDVRLDERPPFFQALLARLFELRSATGRPHVLIVDEAHHLLPSSREQAKELLQPRLDNVIFVTVHPNHVSRAALSAVDELVLVGRNPQGTLDAFHAGRGTRPIQLPVTTEDPAFVWHVRGEVSTRFHPDEPTGDRRRHQRKYAQGELGEDKSFYFRGPEGRLNLRAQNLDLFLQIGSGVDDDTWMYHVERGDLSRWFRDVIKDDGLADEAASIESGHLPARESRSRLREAIERRYTRRA